jgi:hypothetical protein
MRTKPYLYCRSQSNNTLHGESAAVILSPPTAQNRPPSASCPRPWARWALCRRNPRPTRKQRLTPTITPQCSAASYPAAKINALRALPLRRRASALPRGSLSDAEIDAHQHAVACADDLARPLISTPPPPEDSQEKSTGIDRETLAILGRNGENGERGSEMREMPLYFGHVSISQVRYGRGQVELCRGGALARCAIRGVRKGSDGHKASAGFDR